MGDSVDILQFVGAPCGHHGPYTFYKAFKFGFKGKYRIISLGEFFFVKISEDAPVCIGELQLLWEDKNNESVHMSSLRLYFLPEHTPEGRQEYHGQVRFIFYLQPTSGVLTWFPIDINGMVPSAALGHKRGFLFLDVDSRPSYLPRLIGACIAILSAKCLWPSDYNMELPLFLVNIWHKLKVIWSFGMLLEVFLFALFGWK